MNEVARVHIYTAWNDNGSHYIIFKDGLWYASGDDDYDVHTYLPEDIPIILKSISLGESYYITSLMYGHVGDEFSFVTDLKSVGVEI